ncbi:MAG: PEP-CTERM sorting domain-containing protein [Planctomycetales bacterium]|nr:PEP-CTERM sorting domain-containing protein [Planctomycetales bacterium]
MSLARYFRRPLLGPRAIRVYCLALIVLMVNSSVHGQASSSVEQSVWVSATTSEGSTTDNDGTNGTQWDDEGVIPLQKFTVNTRPIGENDATSEAEALVGNYSLITNGANTDCVWHQVQTNIVGNGVAIGALNNTNKGEAKSEAHAHASSSYSTQDSTLLYGFRFALTWNKGRSPMSQYTEFNSSSRVGVQQLDKDNGVVEIREFAGPMLGDPWDNQTVRLTGVFQDSVVACTPGQDDKFCLDPRTESLSFYLQSDNDLTHSWPPPEGKEGARTDPLYLDYTQQYSEFIHLKACPYDAGTSQTKALTPDEVLHEIYRFNYVPTGFWFDPTPANGFTYEMLDDDVLFDEVLDFPTGLDGPVTVVVDGQTLGEYGPGDRLDFVTALGTGVRKFEVTGISPFAQADNTPGFALQLEFSDQTASFSVTPHPVAGTGRKRILSPVAVTENNLGTFSGDAKLENMIDQSGLNPAFDTGETGFEAFLKGNSKPQADDDYRHYWQSGVSLDSSFAGSIDFDLGDVYAVDELAIWNGTLEDISISVAESPEGPWQSVGEFSLPSRNPLLYPLVDADVLDLGATFDARYVRLDVLSAYPMFRGETFTYAILREFAASVTQDAALPGDLNGNHVLDSGDIDLLTAQLRANGADSKYDLDQNGTVDDADLTFWVHELKQTYFGDANLNQVFDTADLVQVFAAGKYESGEAAGWEQGDWDGNGLFDTSDLVAAFVDGGYENGPRANVAAVPEPSSMMLFAVGLPLFACFRRQKSR